MLSKKSTISSTNWENQHYFETLPALTLKIRTSFNYCSKFECWNWYLRSKYLLKFEVNRFNTDHDCKSWWHFGALRACQLRAERACTILSIDYLMVISCNTFGVATSPNVADLSTSFNGMNLKMWSSTSSSFGIVFVGSWALNDSAAARYSTMKFWALNAENTRDAQSTKSKFYEH